MLELLQNVKENSTLRQQFRVVVNYKYQIGELIRTVCKESVNFVEDFRDVPRNMSSGSDVSVDISPVNVEGCKDIRDVLAIMLAADLNPLTVHDAIALYTQHQKAFAGDLKSEEDYQEKSLLILCGDTKVMSPLLLGLGRDCIVGVEIVKPRYASFVQDLQVRVGYMRVDERPQLNWRLYSVKEVK